MEELGYKRAAGFNVSEELQYMDYVQVQKQSQVCSIDVSQRYIINTLSSGKDHDICGRR